MPRSKEQKYAVKIKGVFFGKYIGLGNLAWIHQR
jgi:hypothetical protein